MLSKIVDAEKAEGLVLEKFVLPSMQEVDQIITEKKNEAKRGKILDTHKEDPLQAARKEANQIMVEAQEKLKAAELEANAMKMRQEKAIRAQLEKEFGARLETELRNAAQNYQGAIEAVLTLKDHVYKRSEQELMALVFSITKKIIGDQIETSPQVVLSMLQKGFMKLRDAKQYEIKTNPADYELLMQQKAHLKETLNISGDITLTADDSIQRGGVHILSESGEVAADPGKQLDIIMKELFDGS